MHSAQKVASDYLPTTLLFSAFCIACALLQYFNGLQNFSLHINSVLQGQYWRLITSHLTHLDWQHYAMNMAGLGLCLAVYYRDVKVRHWLYSFVFIALLSSAAMIMMFDGNYRYVGFSDILHGWILLGAMAIFHQEPKFTIAIFVLFWLKILEENLNFSFFTSYGVSGKVAKESHIFGAIGGMIYGLAIISLRHIKKSKTLTIDGE